MAGDPIEYFNWDFLRLYGQETGKQSLNINTMLEEMERRRTSPNGVFGLNVKFDQIRNIIKNVQFGLDLVQNCDYVIYLYRRNKIRQAVSGYKGRVRGTFNVWKSDKPPADQDREIPFNFAGITNMLKLNADIEKQWLDSFEERGISYYRVSFEDLLADFHGTLAGVLDYMEIAHDPAALPEPPTQPVRDWRDERLLQQYLQHLDPDGAVLTPAAPGGETG